MDENQLRMNTIKIEFIMFGNLTQLAKCTPSNLCVNGDNEIKFQIKLNI